MNDLLLCVRQSLGACQDKYLFSFLAVSCALGLGCFFHGRLIE